MVNLTAFPKADPLELMRGQREEARAERIARISTSELPGQTGEQPFLLKPPQQVQGPGWIRRRANLRKRSR